MRSTGRFARLSLQGILVGGALVSAACSDSTSTTASQPSSIVFIGSNTLTGTVGQALSNSLQIEIRDTRGATVPNVPFTVTVSSGSIAGAATKTVVGTTSIGTWTLGTTAGQQQLTVASPGLPSLVLSATAAAGPASVKSTEGQPTTAQGTPGTVAPIIPQIRITDSFGNPIVGVQVAVEITGGGSVQFQNPVTNSNGFATAGTWTLGQGLGAQVVTLSVPGLAPLSFTVQTGSAFNIDVRFFGNASGAITAAFTNAVNRIGQIIVGELPDIPVNGDFAVCFQGSQFGPVPLNEIVDDILILARIAPIDGPGGTLGVGSFCAWRPSSNLPAVGFMIFDQADANNAAFGDVVLHEMFHAIGIGTFWQPTFTPNLTQGYGGSNPIFLGAQARSHFTQLGGVTPAGVPLENTGGSGSAGGHWRQTGFFGNELMTAFYNPGAPSHPISRVTVAALADFGYTVSFAAADQFTVGSSPAALLFQGAATPIQLGDGRDWRPQFEIDEKGRLTRINR